jgi:MFS family permease
LNNSTTGESRSDVSGLTVEVAGDPKAEGGGWGAFPWLWGATAISALGDGVRLTAMPLLALSLTSSPVLISMVSAANWAPLLLSPIAGALADRYDRRALLIGIDLIRGLAVTLLAVCVLSHTVNLAVICVAAFLFGLGETTFTVTYLSFLPEVVAKYRIASANGRLQAAQVVFRDSIGQPLGSACFVAVAALPFFIDGVSFFGGVLLLLAVTTVRRPAVGPPESFRTILAGGFRYLRVEKLQLLLAVMLGVLNLFVVAVETLQVLYVVKALGLPEKVFGLFLTAGALGGLSGALLSSRLRTELGLFPTALGGLALIGASCLLLGFSEQPVLAAVAFAGIHFGISVYQTLTLSFRQSSVPGEIFGRVVGVCRLIGTGTTPIGALVAGVLAQLFGIRVPFLVSGIGILLLAVMTVRPLLREGDTVEI